MPALVINGLTVPVGVESLRRTLEEVGERVRAFDGTSVLNRRWTKRVFDFLIPVASQTDQLAWSALLRGEGHVFGFDSSLYSAKGLLCSGATAAVGSTAPAPKFGAGRLGTGASSATIASRLGYAWTVLVWYWSGSAWVHYAVTSTGQKWVDGVRNDAASTTWLSVSAAGDVTLSSSIFLDSLVLLPAVVPTTWPPILAATGRAFPPLPRLEAHGDIFPGSSSSSPVFARGDATSLDYAPAWIGGTWVPASGALVAQVTEE